jgi:hypothetical protein
MIRVYGCVYILRIAISDENHQGYNGIKLH